MGGFGLRQVLHFSLDHSWLFHCPRVHVQFIHRARQPHCSPQSSHTESPEATPCHLSVGGNEGIVFSRSFWYSVVNIFFLIVRVHGQHQVVASDSLLHNSLLYWQYCVWLLLSAIEKNTIEWWPWLKCFSYFQQVIVDMKLMSSPSHAR